METKANSPINLCLGPRQSGKTHLLSSLQSSGSITNVSHSVPTIGTNIFTIKLPETYAATSTNSGKSKANSAGIRRSIKRPGITIMEIGGQMAPMWTNYLNNVSKILYVIDTSNLCQISAAGEYLLVHLSLFQLFQRLIFISGVLLYSLLADPRLQHTKCG